MITEMIRSHSWLLVVHGLEMTQRIVADTVWCSQQDAFPAGSVLKDPGPFRERGGKAELQYSGSCTAAFIIAGRSGPRCPRSGGKRLFGVCAGGGGQVHAGKFLVDISGSDVYMVIMRSQIRGRTA